jgi:hypothetical protein
VKTKNGLCGIPPAKSENKISNFVDFRTQSFSSFGGHKKCVFPHGLGHLFSFLFHRRGLEGFQILVGLGLSEIQTIV